MLPDKWIKQGCQYPGLQSQTNWTVGKPNLKKRIHINYIQALKKGDLPFSLLFYKQTTK